MPFFRFILIAFFISIASSKSTSGSITTFGSSGHFASLVSAFLSTEVFDTLLQVGPSLDSLNMPFSYDSDLTIIGLQNYAVTVLGRRLRLTGNIEFVDLNIIAALYVDARENSFRASNSRFSHPGIGTDPAIPGFELGFQVSRFYGNQCIFESQGNFLNIKGIYFFSEVPGITSQVFDRCTLRPSGGIVWQNYTSGSVKFLNCSISGGTQSGPWALFGASADLDTVIIDSCHFDMNIDKFSNWTFLDVKNIFVENCNFYRWGYSSFNYGGINGNGPLFLIDQASTRPRPKNVIFKSNIVNSVENRSLGSTGLFFLFDRDTSSTLRVINNTVMANNCNEFDYFFKCSSNIRNGIVADNNIFAGTVSIAPVTSEDTTSSSFGKNWLISSNTFDHSNWTPTQSVSTLFTFCGSYSLIENNTFKSGLCSHLVLLNDDTISNGIWRSANNGWGASNNILRNNLYEQFASYSHSFGIVDKGKCNRFFNEIIRQHGSLNQTSRAFFMVGDSATISQCSIFVDKAGPGLHGVLDDGRWCGQQSRGNLLLFSCIIGSCDYAVISTSGDGSGWFEKDNTWDLLCSERFDIDCRTLDATSRFEECNFNDDLIYFEQLFDSTSLFDHWYFRSGQVFPPNNWTTSDCHECWSVGPDINGTDTEDLAATISPITHTPQWLIMPVVFGSPNDYFSTRINVQNQSGNSVFLGLYVLSLNGWALCKQWEFVDDVILQDSLLVVHLTELENKMSIFALNCTSQNTGSIVQVDDITFGEYASQYFSPHLTIKHLSQSLISISWSRIPCASQYLVETSTNPYTDEWIPYDYLNWNQLSKVVIIDDLSSSFRLRALSTYNFDLNP
jgi:hypothetical protein